MCNDNMRAHVRAPCWPDVSLWACVGRWCCLMSAGEVGFLSPGALVASVFRLLLYSSVFRLYTNCNVKF